MTSEEERPATSMEAYDIRHTKVRGISDTLSDTRSILRRIYPTRHVPRDVFIFRMQSSAPFRFVACVSLFEVWSWMRIDFLFRIGAFASDQPEQLQYDYRPDQWHEQE